MKNRVRDFLAKHGMIPKNYVDGGELFYQETAKDMEEAIKEYAARGIPSNDMYGMMMRPCTFDEAEYEKVWSSSDDSVTEHFFESYRRHTAAKQIVAGCAKLYILKNHEKVTDWSNMNVIIEDNTDDVTDYYHFQKRRIRFKKKNVLDEIDDRIDVENKLRHNPVSTVTNVVLDTSDGDFSLTINGTHHLWISNDSVIVIAAYIEKQLRANDVAAAERSLSDQCRLLISGDAADRQCLPEHGKCGRAEISRAIAHFRQALQRNVE